MTETKDAEIKAPEATLELVRRELPKLFYGEMRLLSSPQLEMIVALDALTTACVAQAKLDETA